MDSAVENVVRACTEGSDASRLAFPEVVARLAAAGIERYHADLERAEKVYYLPDGQSLAVPAKRIEAEPGGTFSAAGVEAAVRAIQQRRIDYREFCERIAAAGCVGYLVSLAGGRAVYYGRTAEVYVEPFPTAA